MSVKSFLLKGPFNRPNFLRKLAFTPCILKARLNSQYKVWSYKKKKRKMKSIYEK